jgi:glycopeptide antibiotics resistance protein
MRRHVAFCLVVIAIAALTFPWDLQDHSHWFKATWIPFATGILRPRDLALNLALYVPLGFWLPVRSARRRIAVALAVALLLSTAMELAQVWSHLRIPSATDTAMNVLGSVVGALASVWRDGRLPTAAAQVETDADVLSA